MGVGYLLLALLTAVLSGSVRDMSVDAAVTNVLLFRDDCTGIDASLVVSNPDGSGRQVLPPVLARSADLSRGAPAMDALAVARSADGALPFRLFAIPIDRTASGQIAPGITWQALDDPAVTEPTGSAQGGVVFTPGGQHVAFIGRPAGSSTIGTHIYIAEVARNATGHAAGITGVMFVVDLMTIGSPADSSHPQASVGAIDLSEDGTKLLAVIYDDIWMISLNPTSWIMTGATNLTRTPDFAEMYARWSPAMDAIAFSGGGYAELGGRWWYSADTNVFTMNSATLAVKQVTTKTTHKGSRPAAEFPSWSPGGTHLLYGAETGGSGPRNSPCGSLVNDDLYRILATGTQKTVNVTNTAGTSVEAAPRWGW